MTPTNNWPRLAGFREHNIELPVGEIAATPNGEKELRVMLNRALDLGKGVLQIVSDGNGGMFVYEYISFMMVEFVSRLYVGRHRTDRKWF